MTLNTTELIAYLLIAFAVGGFFGSFATSWRIKPRKTELSPEGQVDQDILTAVAREPEPSPAPVDLPAPKRRGRPRKVVADNNPMIGGVALTESKVVYQPEELERIALTMPEVRPRRRGRKPRTH